MMPQSDKSHLMTEGVIWKHVLIFSVPLIIGNFFQQMYNTVDTLVIGNFLGRHALAAVGAGAVIIQMMLSLFVGLSTGAGVVIAQCFGARDNRSVRRSVSTSAAFTLASGVFLTVVGIAACGLILEWINTPDEVMRDAKLYLRIYFAGIIPLLIYNMGAAVLRAVGDSRTPLYYLAIAMVTNAVLDVVFVAVFGMGVEGVAIATLIAQALAAYLVVRKLQNAPSSYRLNVAHIHFDGRTLRRILRVGVPAGMQQMMMGFSNVVVQSFINSLGAVTMAAWNVFGKLDGIIILPILSFGLAMTTFTGQNVGAGKSARVYEGLRVGLKMNCGFAIVLSFLFYIFAGDLLVFFTSEPEILEYGKRMVRGLSPFYFLIAIMYSYSGVINGAGYSFATMLIMLTNLCVARIAFLKIASRYVATIDVAFLAYIVSWGLCSLGLYIYYVKGSWRKSLAGDSLSASNAPSAQSE